MSLLNKLLGSKCSSLYHYHLGIERGLAGDFRKARDEFEMSVAINPDDLSSQEALALARDSETGVISPETALHLFRGAQFANHGALEDALREFEAALLSEQNYGRVYGALASVHGASGRYGEAISCMQKEIQLEPSNANAR